MSGNVDPRQLRHLSPLVCARRTLNNATSGFLWIGPARINSTDEGWHPPTKNWFLYALSFSADVTAASVPGTLLLEANYNGAVIASTDMVVSGTGTIRGYEKFAPIKMSADDPTPILNLYCNKNGANASLARFVAIAWVLNEA